MSDFIENLKYKLNKNYTLTSKSPELLKRNIPLIIKTVKNNPYYLNEVPEDILLDELQSGKYDSKGIIYNAVMSGYTISPNTPLFKSGNAVSFLKNHPELINIDFIKQLDDTSDLLNDSDFLSIIADIYIKNTNENDMKYPPGFLLRNSKFLDIYMRDKKSIDININQQLKYLSSDKQLFSTLVNGFKSSGVDKNVIFSNLYIECLRQNNPISIDMLSSVFPDLTLRSFELVRRMDDIYNLDDYTPIVAEVKNMLKQNQSISRNIPITFLNSNWGDYSIDKFKLITSANDSKTYLDMISSFDEKKVKLYVLLSNEIDKITNNYNRYDSNVIESLFSKQFDSLIGNLDIDNLTQDNIDNLLNILMANNTAFKQHVNTFGIDNLRELDNLDNIKNLVSDILIKNPSLDNLSPEVEKYVKNFTFLDNIDRVKTGILLKKFDVTLFEARDIYNKFCVGLTQNDKLQNDITLDKLNIISKIITSNDLTELMSIDLSATQEKNRLLYEEALELYNNKFNEQMHINSNNRTQVDYNGSKIDIIDASSDFSMIVKRVRCLNNDESYKKEWNIFEKYDSVRYNTCTSYMTPEILLSADDCVIFGFDNITGYNIKLINKQDCESKWNGDPFYYPESDRYMMPDNLVAKTTNGGQMSVNNHITYTLDMAYNEIVIDTFSGNEQRLQPQYVVYIEDDTDENRSRWQASMKAASDFGIPIVTMNRKKIMEAQYSQIINDFNHLGDKNMDVIRFIEKYDHFSSRYGDIPQIKLAVDAFRKKYVVNDFEVNKIYEVKPRKIEQNLLEYQDSESIGIHI